jgi:hypothetical protein
LIDDRAGIGGSFLILPISLKEDVARIGGAIKVEVKSPRATRLAGFRIEKNLRAGVYNSLSTIQVLETPIAGFWLFIFFNSFLSRFF